MAKTAGLATLETQYKEILPFAERLRDEIVHQVTILIDRENISLGFPITARIKSWESIREKVPRLPLNLRSLHELQDLVGVRLIALFRRDADQLSYLVESTFNVLHKVDTLGRLKEDQFGYSSVHYVVAIPESWRAVPSLAQLGNLRAEIQIRTVAQHLWAAASHVLQYKHEASVPEPVRRSIHRVSALLETVDLEFERVLTEKSDYRSQLDSLQKAATNLSLNSDSLEAILVSLLPPDNKHQGEDYGELLGELQALGLRTQDKIMNLLRKHMDAILREDAEQVQDSRAMGVVEPGDEERIYDKGVYFSHVGLVRCALEREFGERWRKISLRRIRPETPSQGMKPTR